MRRLTIALVAIVSVASAVADDLSVIGYNVESDRDTQWTQVAEDMESLGPIDIWGLSEVQSRSAVRVFRHAAIAGANDPDAQYYYLLGESGGSDRLAIIYNQNRFARLDVYELEEEVGGSRPPLVAHLRDVNSGQELLFMVNHLNRGDAGKRRMQAVGLQTWAETVGMPVIAVGDYNFDWDIESGEGNKAFDLFLEGDHWSWVFPNCGLDDDFSDCQPTQCNPNYTSILDFLFVAGEAVEWNIQSDILEPRDDYCSFDADGGADHLPIIGIVSPPE